MSDMINRNDALEIIQSMYPGIPRVPWMRKDWQERYEPYIRAEKAIRGLPSAQPEPLSDAYMKSVWTWLLEYQIKAAELKGRYTPYEVLSWVVNDWRKEHEGSD